MVRRPRFAARAIWVSGFCGVTFTSNAPAASWLIIVSLSVRHRRHLSGECVLEAEITQVAHPLREQDAVEMIDLVLHHAGMEAFHGPLERRTVLIETAVAQPAKARYQTPHSGHGETAFPTVILLGRERGDKWIHQYGVGHR